MISTLSDSHGRIVIGTPGDIEAFVRAEWQGQSSPARIVLVFTDQFQAEQFIRRHFGEPSKLSRLRGLLSLDCYRPSECDDNAIYAEAAARLARRQWRAAATPLHHASSAASPALSGAVNPPVANALGRAARGQIHSRANGQAGRTPSARALLPATLADEAEWAETIDQDRQAAALEKAARDDKPFCAICMLRRIERALASKAGPLS